jgi:spore germination protein
MRNLLAVFLGITAGIAAGIFVSPQIAGKLQDISGMRETPRFEILGFQPFWLLDSANQSYESYLTSYTYFGLQIGDDGRIRRENSPGELEPGWNNLQTERVKSTLNRIAQYDMKRSLAVQNANESSIERLLEDPEAAANNLIDDVRPIMETYDFNDLNLDIESFSSAPVEKRAAFTTFVRTVKAGMDRNELGTLSIDVTPVSFFKQHLIDVPAIAEDVDTVVVMAYDYHYSGSYTSGPVAPLGGAGKSIEFDVTTTVQEALKVLPRDKILLGIPTYGYEWHTLSPHPRSEVIAGTGKAATAKRIERTIANCKDCITGRDEEARQPYAIIPTSTGYYRQIFYEDATSMREKIDLAQAYGLKGIAIWALGYETESFIHELTRARSSYRDVAQR